MTAPLIADHPWRPPHGGNSTSLPMLDRPCEYMTCRRPRSEHESAVSGGGGLKLAMRPAAAPDPWRHCACGHPMLLHDVKDMVGTDPRCCVDGCVQHGCGDPDGGQR